MNTYTPETATAAQQFASARAALNAALKDRDMTVLAAFRAARVALLLSLAEEASEMAEPDESFMLLQVARRMNVFVDPDAMSREMSPQWPAPPDGPTEREFSRTIVAVARAAVADEDFPNNAVSITVADVEELIADEESKLTATTGH